MRVLVATSTYRRCGFLVGGSCRRLFGWPSLNKEKSAERKKQLKLEFEKGYISELQEYRKNKGKRFHAESALVARDVAVRFPSFSGCSLSGVSLNLPLPQPSLVLISMKGSGMRMCDHYRKLMEGEFDEKNWIEHNLRKAIPSNRHNTHMVCIGKMASELRKVLDVRNSIVGHACLLDREGLVRWTAHATPTQSELQAMTKCTKDLLAGH